MKFAFNPFTGNFDGVDPPVAVQTAGLVGFATKAAMDADLNHSETTVALVTNDPDWAKNRYYRKTGASGAGNWVAAEDATSHIVDGRSIYRHDRAVSFQDQDGGEFAYIDELGALHLVSEDLYAGGNNVGASSAQVVSDANYNASRYAVAFTDDSMGLLGGFDDEGYFRCGPYRLRLESQFPPLAAFTKATVGYKAIACWGDSLTAATYPASLRQLTGLSVFQGAVSGADSNLIATYSGAVAPIVSLANDTIPASGPVETTYNPSHIRTSNSFNTSTGSIKSGDKSIPGSWTYVRTGTYPNQYVLNFTRTTPGDAVVIDPKVAFVVDQVPATDFGNTASDGLENDHKITVIWSGRNGGWQTSEARDQTVANIGKMVAFLKPLYKRFVVMSIINGVGEGVGTEAHTNITALNERLLALYPDNFIDIRKVLVRAYDSNNATDVQNFADDIPPSTLRSDTLHLNSTGYALVAQTVFNFLALKGWLV